MPELLARIWAFTLLVLEGTGAAARVERLSSPFPPGLRLLAATLTAASLLLLLYALLASGPDNRVRSFRGGTLLAALALPVGALRTPPALHPAWGGGAILLVLLAGILHAALARRRREGTASRALEMTRLLAESAGLVLFLAGAVRLALGEAVPMRLAFWALFLLRMSVADLLRPAALVFESGLPRSALSDLKSAAGVGRRRRRPGAGARVSRAVSGSLKGLLMAVWLALPLLAIAAPDLVARGLWPRPFLHLTAYPSLALGATAALLLLRSARSFTRVPLLAARGAVVGLASLLYLLYAYRDPAFASYRAHVPGIVLCEALFGFLLGTAARTGRPSPARIRPEGRP